ncbi:helix-turn-helix transcriptional regulator [Nocardia sp. NBC_01327]|uniref:helix-turn-helix transcriptional regulator n=1 Tax=Nocardia sp. NBC_01327 TaxID=2903593 RepID=UPI002E155460|nr:helix-turn-helix transcriptional regulator [Nocardia sp. NBC_01327]
MGSGAERHNELGEFLRTRRAQITPDQVGLPAVGQPRRVAGLRREEVAQLAAISADYYTRLEQGRLTSASESALTAIARALRLDADDEIYLRQLARKSKVRRGPAVQRARPATELLLNNLIDTPAIVLGRHMDILAWNRLAAALFTDFAEIPVEQRNFVRMAFLDPAVRGRYVAWEATARICVEYLRMDAVEFPDDPRLMALVGELSVRDADFRDWWAARHVARKTFGAKTFHHPAAGELTLDWQMLACLDDPHQTILVMTAVPGTPSHQALRFLASWADPADGPPASESITATPRDPDYSDRS